MSEGQRPFTMRMGAAIARAPRHFWVLAAIVLIGLVLRIAYNDVPRYSPADEGHYVATTRALAERGWSHYPALVQDHLARRDAWPYPSPVRWGYLGLTTLACAVRSPCDARALAWLSTLAGAVSILFTYLAGARLVGRRAALLAAALTITSPLQLALSRRALSDEVVCAVFLVAFWALVRLVQEGPSGPRWAARGRIAAFVLASALAFGVKEAFAFPYVAFVAIYLLAPRDRPLRLGDGLILAAPPALFFAGFALLSRSGRAFFDLLAIGQASFLGDYSLQYQSGPPHRPLFDLFVLAPIVCLLAAAAIARVASPRDGRRAGGARVLAALLVIALVAFMGLPKNLRFVVILDPILRLLAAWTWIEHHEGAPERAPWRASIAVAIHAVPELALFHRTFIAHRTYDPTTHDILQALGAVPRSPASAEPDAWPPVFFAAAALAVAALVLARRHPVTPPEETHEKSAAAPENGAGPAGDPSAAAPAPGVSRRERLITIGAAAVCVVIALFVGRSCGPSPQAGPSTVSGLTADPVAEQMNAGLAAADPAVAVTHFRKALELHPGHYGATFQLARALDRAGRKDEASKQWERVLALAEQAKDQPLADMARARLAQSDPMAMGLDALHTKRDPVTAAARFREVLAQNPEHYGATFQLATALDQSNKPAEARPVWEKMLKMAEAIQDAKTVDTARARLAEIDRTLGAPPADDPAAEPMRQAVEALHTKRDPAGAVVLLKKILAQNPEHYGATFQLATALDQAGKPAEARPVWEKMLEMAESAKDPKTADAARARLAKKP